jgi:hypothetical protein
MAHSFFSDENHIHEFIQIYKAETAVELSIEEATPLAENLSRFFDLIYRPIQKDWSSDRGP